MKNRLFEKINIWSIVSNHLSTLKNDYTQKASIGDYITFLILPVLISLTLLYFRIVLSDEAINIIISSLAILVGLLFNVIVLIFDIVKRDATKKIKNQILKELVSNISFTILVSLIAIIFSVFTFIHFKSAQLTFSTVVYFLLTLFILTFLMILKRIHKLFLNEMQEIQSDNIDSSNN